MKTASGSCRQWATSLASGAQMTPDGCTYPQGPEVANLARLAIDSIRARVRSGAPLDADGPLPGHGGGPWSTWPASSSR
jgi:hypothetical protein